MSGLYHRQEKLKLNSEQSITVVGAGGIGYWVAKFAAMSGIEMIYVFDDDTLEEHAANGGVDVGECRRRQDRGGYGQGHKL